MYRHRYFQLFGFADGEIAAEDAAAVVARFALRKINELRAPCLTGCTPLQSVSLSAIHDGVARYGLGFDLDVLHDALAAADPGLSCSRHSRNHSLIVNFGKGLGSQIYHATGTIQIMGVRSRPSQHAIALSDLLAANPAIVITPLKKRRVRIHQPTARTKRHTLGLSPTDGKPEPSSKKRGKPEPATPALPQPSVQQLQQLAQLLQLLPLLAQGPPSLLAALPLLQAQLASLATPAPASKRLKPDATASLVEHCLTQNPDPTALGSLLEQMFPSAKVAESSASTACTVSGLSQPAAADHAATDLLSGAGALNEDDFALWLAATDSDDEAKEASDTELARTPSPSLAPGPTPRCASGPSLPETLGAQSNAGWHWPTQQHAPHNLGGDLPDLDDDLEHFSVASDSSGDSHVSPPETFWDDWEVFSGLPA
mmetsp:Transcript_21988/g.51564  ORF Transcript_21988/g.51564 Transcript_21988/m.51564 type:complete len:427 (+) Transcript_21988:1002-2282(+)